MYKILYILLLLPLLCFSQKKKYKNDWKNESLLGKVKAIKETVYHATVINDTLVRDEKNNDCTFTFDKTGNKIEYAHYKGDSINCKHIYLYDGKNNLIEENEICIDSTENYKWSYKYNSKGKLLERTHQDQKDIYSYYNKGQKREQKIYSKKDTKFIWKYIDKFNASGNLIEEAKYYNSGIGSDTNRFFSKRVYSYNRKRKKVEEIVFLNENVNQMKEVTLFERMTFAYDKNGYEIEYIHYNVGQKITQKVTSVRDSQGNAFELCFYDEKGVTYKEVNTYKYDKKGNWIEKTSNYKGENYITTRQIEYFKN